MRQFLIIVLFLGLFCDANSQSKYPTLLWKISGNGLKKESYLYGTMHVSNRVAYHLSDQFFAAIKNSDVIGLETNPSEWLGNMELIGELSRASGVSLYNPYGGNFYKSVFGMRFPDKQVYQSILSFDPEIINGLLYRHSTSQENFEENTYIDLFIFQAASKLNKKVVSLEDFRQSEIKAKLAMIPDDEFSEEKQGYEDYSSGKFDVSEKIEDAYRNGNLDALDSLTKLVESKNMQKYLLHDRNVFFVHHMDSIMRSGKALFSGVGAAHLPGNKGVIELLRRLNYKVEPVFPTQTKKAVKEQEKIDKLIKPIPFEDHLAHDSLYSLQVPGKLTQIMNFDNIKYFINADMANGHFYAVARLKTNAALNNYSVNKMSLKIDSLLFENIPGKIISKQEIVNNGVKGFDIVNKTRRGDLQRYQIFLTDIELILFKLGGKSEFVYSSAGKQFFNSIKFEKRKTERFTFEPATKGFKVQIPNEYNYSRNDYVGVSGLVEDLSAYDQKSGEFYGVKHAIFNDFYYLEEDTFELNRLSAYTLRNFDFKLDPKYETQTEQKVPCIKFKGSNTSGKTFYGKIYIKGVHYYLAFMIGEQKQGFDHAFFRSFQLTDFTYVNEIKEITDKELSFKTKDETSNTASSRFNEELNKVYEQLRDSLKPKKADPYDFDYRTRTKNYYSPSSHEYVEIYFEKFNDYDYRGKKEFAVKVNKALGELLTMNVRNVKQTEQNGLWFYELLLHDTATVRGIKVKVFAKNGTVYQVKVPCDTVLGLNGWSKYFYESFQLLDTVIGKDIFTNKFDLLLKDLVSADTAVKRKATYSLSNSVSMEKEYLDDFLNFVRSDDHLKLSQEAKAQLFVNGGVLGSDKIIDPYKKLYKVYSDSAYLQICLLKGLAYCKTQNSHNAISELLAQEVPLVGDAGVVNDVFKVMQDSLELCKGMFPKLLELTTNTEYHEPVYKLLSLLIKQKIVAPQSLITKKELILADANTELRRYNATISGKSKAANQYSNYGKDADLEQTMELIKANLEAMATNQILKNNRLKDKYNSTQQPLLVSFCQILAPFYQTDAKAKQFVEKIARIRNEQLAMPIFITLKKYGVTLNDTLAKYYSKNVNTRVYFYSELEREGLTDVFSKDQLTQVSLVESLLRTYQKVSAYSNYEPEKTKDSLIFHGQYSVKNKYEKGTVYIFKTSKNKFGLNKWSSVFVPMGKQSISSEITVLKMNQVFDEKLTETEIVNDLLDEFANTYRNRVMMSGTGISYDY